LTISPLHRHAQKLTCTPIDPTGRFLLAENQDSNTIVVFRIDPQTGALHRTGQTVGLPKPVCIKMIPKPNG